METAPSAWKRKTFLFLAGQCVTLFGSSVVQFAIVWFVTRETGSGVWVSALTICSFVPQMLISPAAGAWADRFCKKNLILLADGLIALITLALALLLPSLPDARTVLPFLLGASVLRSLGAGVQLPAVNALLPVLAPEKQLVRINGVNATLQSVVQFAAPAAAGAVLSMSTLRSALFIDIATAAAGMGLLAAIALPAQPKAEPEARPPLLSDLREGVRYVFSDPFLARLLPLYGVFIFLCVPAGFLATLFVSRTYGDSYANLAIVELVGFAGMTAGGLLLSVWGGFRNQSKTLLTGLAAFGALAVCMGAVHSFLFYLALMLIYGVALTMVQASSTALIQSHAEPALQGRVFGLLNTLYCGFLPLGMAVFGPLSDRVRMEWLMIFSGAALLALAAVFRAQKPFYQGGLPKEETPDA